MSNKKQKKNIVKKEVGEINQNSISQKTEKKKKKF
jgi:hypothetical protein